MCPILFVLEHSGTNGNDFMRIKPIGRAERLKVNSNQKHRAFFVTLDTYDNAKFTSAPPFIDILVNMSTERGTVDGYKIAHLEHIKNQ